MHWLLHPPSDCRQWWGNQLAVDNNNQAWHPLKVLDTIEIFRFSLGIADK
jgi:hypothetical protein